MTKKSDYPNLPDLFSPDKPIERREEDVLGRRAFSEALAHAISGWSGRESLILALYGAWGNGKSSIKNMVVDCLQSDSPSVLTVDFNPWQLAHRPTLSEAFFDELGVALGKGDLGSNRIKKAVLARYRRWAYRLQSGRDMVKAIRSVFGSALVAAGLATLGVGWLHSRSATIIFGSMLLIAGALSLFSKLTEVVIKFLEAGTEVGAKSLSEVKAEIAKDLRNLKAPILVIVDDLDRLTPQELLEVFQLIKANGDFPNLIYLVLCERAIVERNVEKALNVPGREYLEKIVQVGFDVPMIDTARVHQVLFQRLNVLLSSEAVSPRFSQRRWNNVFLSGLQSYFSTLRDVNRFISTLAFHFSALLVDGVFEVNPIDLIMLDTIRLFEPEVYKALQSSKDLLTTTGRPDKPQSEVVAQSLSSIVELGSQERRNELRELIKHLFPGIDWAMGGTQYADEFGEQWYRDLRVCSKKLFDRYFRFAVSDQELSQSAIQKLLHARGDREGLQSELESMHSRGLINAAFEELAVHQDEIRPDQVESFITAIFDVADVLVDQDRGLLEVPAEVRVWFLVRKSLKKVEEITARFHVISTAITNTRGLFMVTEFVVLASSPEDGSDKGILPVNELAALKALTVQKIESAASSGALAGNAKLAFLLSVWQQWGKADEVAKYVEALTETKEGTLQLLKSFVSRSVRQSVDEHATRERFYIRRKDVEALIPMDTLDDLVQELPSDELSDEDRRAINAFNKAIERRKLGKSDDDPFAED